MRLEWNRLLNIPGKWIYRDDNKPTTYNQICTQSICETIKHYVLTIMVIMLASIGAVLGPFYSYIYEGTFATFYNLKLPYFNADPPTEFIINIIWETMISLLGIIALFVLEIVIAICNDTISVSSKLTQMELNDLSDKIEKERGAKSKELLQLRMILMRVAHIDEYGQKAECTPAIAFKTKYVLAFFSFTDSSNLSEISCMFAILPHHRHSHSQSLCRFTAS